MIRIHTSDNIQRWLSKFEREANVLRERVTNEPKVQAQFGQRLGIQLAPRDQYATLIHAISWTVIEKGRSSGQAMIWVKPLVHPVDNKSKRTKGRASAYAAIHHALPLGAYHRGQAKSGDPHWLFTVKEELERRYKKAIVGHLQKFR